MPRNYGTMTVIQPSPDRPHCHTLNQRRSEDTELKLPSLRRILLAAASIAIAALIFVPYTLAEKKVPPFPERPRERTFSRSELACLDSRVKPANPDANPSAKQLLAYLKELGTRTDHHILLGQFIGGGDWSGMKEVDKVREKTNKSVAMIGNDYALMHDTSTRGNSYLAQYWHDGGLVTVSFHQLNPEKRKFGSVKSRNINFTELLSPNSKSHQTWEADLDRVAEGLAQLRDYGVVVLWRPYHEMNKDFFWWGQREPREFVELWRQMFDYLTKRKKLDNLLWVYSPYQAGDADKYYPGAELVDIVSLDAYETNVANIQGYDQLMRLNKPFGFGEFGPSGSLIGIFPKVEKNVDYNATLQAIKSRFPKTTFIHAWNGPWGFQSQTSIEQMFSDPAVITRETLDWRTVCSDKGR